MKLRTDEHRPRTVTELLERHRIMDHVRFRYHKNPGRGSLLDRIRIYFTRGATLQRQKARRRLRSNLAYESRRINR
jgi:hypothetical protein